MLRRLGRERTEASPRERAEVIANERTIGFDLLAVDALANLANANRELGVNRLRRRPESGILAKELAVGAVIELLPEEAVDLLRRLVAIVGAVSVLTLNLLRGRLEGRGLERGGDLVSRAGALDPFDVTALVLHLLRHADVRRSDRGRRDSTKKHEFLH